MAYILRAQSVGKKSMAALGELLGIPVYTSDQTIPQDDYAFRWACTSKNLGSTKVINKISSMEETTDKAGFRKKLSDVGLAPQTWTSFDSFLDYCDVFTHEQSATGSEIWKSFIVRPEFHERSKDLHLCTKPSEVYAAWCKVGKGYISEYIKKTQEFRVFVIQNRIAWALEKHPKSEDEVSWGCVQDGDFDYLHWGDIPEFVSECALKSMKLSDLDFGAVDIIVKDGKAYTMEINTAPWLSIYPITCIAKTFKYIIKNGRDHFPDPENYSWKNTIHPAVQIKDLANV